jgi:hypothetical protein
VRLEAAIVASMVVLATGATGLVLTSLGEELYQERARRVLFALYDPPQIVDVSDIDHPLPSLP